MSLNESKPNPLQTCVKQRPNCPSRQEKLSGYERIGDDIFVMRVMEKDEWMIWEKKGRRIEIWSDVGLGREHKNCFREEKWQLLV